MAYIKDIEDIKDIKDIKDLFSSNHFIRKTLDDLLKMPIESYKTSLELTKTLTRIHRQEKIENRGKKDYKGRPLIPKRELGSLYRHLIKKEGYPYIEELYNVLIIRSVRSESGIINVSVVMPGDTFSCKYNCKFCPNEPGMPRSYLHNEDAVSRANENGFDPVRQVWSRFRTLEENGHILDKIEFRVLGGTFSCYKHSVADAFIRDLYYAANTYFEDEPRRSCGTIEEEHEFNLSSKIHVVGLGVETRPDEITENELLRFRKYGVTRVELGIQHTNDLILKIVNRGHTIDDSKRATRMLKDYGFKIEIHVMADLPGATPFIDKECYSTIFSDPDLTPDYMKDYPCLDVAYTEIRKWKEDGRWMPYAEHDGGKFLHDVLIYRQSITPKWVRVNRIQRDFRPEHELGFTSETLATNLAMTVKNAAEKQGVFCQCIRCCEIRDETFNEMQIKYNIYRPSDKEYFIAAEVERVPRNLMLGFVRLRLPVQKTAVKCLTSTTALIRELHVYGKVNPVGVDKSSQKGAQHLGIGKTLLKMAEKIAMDRGYTSVAVISGIGVREYYRKLGYTLRDTYMVKEIAKEITYKIMIEVSFFLFFLLIECLYTYYMWHERL